MCWLDVNDSKVRSEVLSRIEVDPAAIVPVLPRRVGYRVLALTFAIGVSVGWLLRILGG